LPERGFLPLAFFGRKNSATLEAALLRSTRLAAVSCATVNKRSSARLAFDLSAGSFLDASPLLSTTRSGRILVAGSLGRVLRATVFAERPCIDREWPKGNAFRTTASRVSAGNAWSATKIDRSSWRAAVGLADAAAKILCLKTVLLLRVAR
jgi:hypothetical protein